MLWRDATCMQISRRVIKIHLLLILNFSRNCDSSLALPKAGSDHDIARELKIYRTSAMAYRIAKEISEQLQQVQQQCSTEIEQVLQAE